MKKKPSKPTVEDLLNRIDLLEQNQKIMIEMLSIKTAGGYTEPI